MRSSRLRVCCFVVVAVLGPGPVEGARLPPRWSVELGQELDRAAAGDTRGCNSLGAAIIRVDPENWIGWYLRRLGGSASPLSVVEKEALERLQPDSLRESIRGLLAHLASDPGDRGLLARDLAERWPRSALAQALHSSQLLYSGDATNAATIARKALDLDPDMWLAGRVLALAAAAVHDAERASLLSCDLLRRFPGDRLIVDHAISLCRITGDIENRLRLFGPVLAAHQGRPTASVALSRVLAGDDTMSTRILDALLELLDPSDPSWWSLGDRLAGRIEASGSGSERETEFLTAWWQAAIASGDPLGRAVGQEFVTPALAMHLIARDRSDHARRILEAVLPAVPELHRERHLRALARVARVQGRVSEAQRLDEDADLLGRPWTRRAETRSAWETRVKRLFPSLATVALLRGDGSSWSFATAPPRPRIIVFWDLHCSYVRREAERLRAMQADPSSVLRRESVEVLWVNLDRASTEQAVLRRADSLGLRREDVRFEPPGRTPLRETLGVRGSPWLVLVTASARAVLEIPEFRTRGWSDEVSRTLRVQP